VSPMLWLKAFHVIAVISWMAGLLYLPRLFVYHCGAEPGSQQSETFKVMETRLLRLIMNPAMIVVWITGPILAWQQGMLGDRWLWAKVALVVVLTGFHHALGLWRKELAAGTNRRDARFYRFANEVPTVLMVGIVILVIVKPF
jgi:protoporphyrinogen IX oxidase